MLQQQVEQVVSLKTDVSTRYEHVNSFQGDTWATTFSSCSVAQDGHAPLFAISNSVVTHLDMHIQHYGVRLLKLGLLLTMTLSALILPGLSAVSSCFLACTSSNTPSRLLDWSLVFLVDSLLATSYPALLYSRESIYCYDLPQHASTITSELV